MISIQEIRQANNKIIVLGNHEPIIQSILDFDYLSGKKETSLTGIVTGRRGYAKYFWGRGEVLIPTYSNFPQVGKNTWFLNLTSGRRALSSSREAITQGAIGGTVFAENTPELHALELIKVGEENQSLIVGPASVGLLIPSVLKLGPIGGITPDQIEENHLIEPGSIAIMSASGGMTNELINIAVSAGHHISFALSFGGDRFPVLSPREAFLLAESDPATKTILYYGELGGEDEYELVKLKEEKLFTKHVVAHVAGTVASLFPESPQFGHAKAKADNTRVTAMAKRKALQSAGFLVSNSFREFIASVNKIKS